MIDIAILSTVGAVVSLTALIIVLGPIMVPMIGSAREQALQSDDDVANWWSGSRRSQLDQRSREVEAANYELFTGEYSYP